VLAIVSGCGGGGPAGNKSLIVKAQPQEFTAGNMHCNLVLKVYNATSSSSSTFPSTLLYTTFVILDDQGVGSAVLSVPSGVYDIYVKEPTHLSVLYRSWVYNPNSPGTLNFGTLYAGDCNNDDTVNQLDLSYLTSKWNTNDPLADINRDGIVNQKDMDILNAILDPVNGLPTGGPILLP